MSIPTIYDFADEFKISLAKVRAIAKRYPHWFNSDLEPAEELRAYLSKGKGATAPQLASLIENPSWLLALGRYAGEAQRELDKLDRPQDEVAPKEVVANLMEAAKGEAEGLAILVNWLRSIVPEKPVGHSYIAVRLILGIPESIRKSESARIPRALLNARAHPDFAGWWRSEKRASRNVTIYQKTNLDL